jgi:hydroxylamine dehydrogenase
MSEPAPAQGRDESKFAGVFTAVVLGTGLVVGALVLNHQRPDVEVAQPNAALVRASGKCAECHRRETSAVVHQFESSKHAAEGITCLDCHAPVEGQESTDHRGFAISPHLTAKNCAQCHATQYDQFLRSRHAAPAWAALEGARDFTAEQVAFSEQYHAGWVDRPANALVALEGPEAMRAGCAACHKIGQPNPDGSIGTCTACHSRHSSSVALAREPQTCGQCHMGPDHSQLEIFTESKHGVLFNAQRGRYHMDADPKTLTTKDMPTPTCATCHMSGLEGQNVTHDTTQRLSWFLFQDISEKRPTHAQGRDNMQETCLKCHAHTQVQEFYSAAEDVLLKTNDDVQQVKELMQALRDEGLLTPQQFDETIEFTYFDFWHYYGRTAKHGAYMGGADFVQWHGNYELLKLRREIEEMAADLRHAARGRAP